MYYVCLRATTYLCLESCQVSSLDYTRIQCLIFASSAPGDSPPPQRNTHGTVSDVRRDVVKAGVIISEVQRDVANTQAMVRDVLKNQQEAGGQDRSVSDTCALFSVGCTLTTT